MKTPKLLPLGLFIAAFIFIGAAPQNSGYSTIPERKIRTVEGNTPNTSTVREADVRPEEAYKYGVQEFALIASDTGYFPQRIIVRRNIPVHLFLTSSSNKALCFVFDEFSIRKGIASQGMEEVRFLPTKAGQYKFYCPVQEIQGSIVVRD